MVRRIVCLLLVCLEKRTGGGQKKFPIRMVERLYIIASLPSERILQVAFLPSLDRQ